MISVFVHDKKKRRGYLSCLMNDVCIFQIFLLRYQSIIALDLTVSDYVLSFINFNPYRRFSVVDPSSDNLS